jgi:serine/threonine protein kinase
MQKHILGRGAFGRVYPARLNGGRIVAIKVMDRKGFLQRARGCLDKAQLKFERCLAREIEIMKALYHPFIVGFYEHLELHGENGKPKGQKLYVADCRVNV